MGFLGALTFGSRNPAAVRDDALSHDDPLLARIQRADEDAFRTLFERHAPGVRRFLKDLLRDETAADEGTQETFVRAHRRISGLKDGSKLTPWLLGIARNIALETLRARRMTPVSVSALDEGEAHAVLLRAVLPVPTPEALLLGRETDALLSKALATLSGERRAALLLRLDHGLAYEDIARDMGWSLQKVKNEIHRARLQLRAELAHHLEVTT